MNSLLWFYFWFKVAKYMADQWNAEQRRNVLRRSLATSSPVQQPRRRARIIQFPTGQTLHNP